MTAVEQLRYADRFTSVDGLTIVNFPLRGYEYEPAQGYRPTLAVVPFADFAYDFSGAQRWPMDNAAESVRFILAKDPLAVLNSTYETMLGSILRIGEGKLWTIDHLGSRRWAYAKLNERASYRSATSQWGFTPVELVFDRRSTWRGENAISTTVVCDANPEDFTLTNNGELEVEAIRMRLRANGSFADPALFNLTNGWQWTSTRDSASVNSELDVDSGLYRVRYSNDDGVTYSDDWANFTRPATQHAFMRLNKGANSMRAAFSAVPNANLEITYYEEWP